MAVIVRDPDLEKKLDAERQRKFGDGGSLARVLRDIARDHFIREEVKPLRPPRRRERVTA